MTRYKQVLLSEPYYHSCMRPHEDGDYVRHSDAQAEIAKLTQDRDRYAQLTERMKCALRKPGTEGSYVEWAAECRDAVDKLNDAQAEIHRLIDLLQSAFMDGVDAGMKARENFAETMKQFEQWQKQQEPPDESK